MALTDGVGGSNRTGGMRLNGLDPMGGADPNGIGGMSTKELLEKLVQMMNPQQQAQQGAQGSPQQQGGPQGAGGAQPSGGGSGGQFSLEELMKELQKRAQMNQDEMANQLRQVRNTQQPSGGQNQQQSGQQPGGITNQLLATAPVAFDAGNMGGLNIQSGGGFSGGGAFA
jgi:hypothetical protein